MMLEMTSMTITYDPCSHLSVLYFAVMRSGTISPSHSVIILSIFKIIGIFFI